MANEHRTARAEPPAGEPTRAFLEAFGGQAANRSTPGDAFMAARGYFRRGEKLDMVTLASDLGVARATLYRWTGDRDRLLADVIWAELHDLIAAAAARSSGTGLQRIEQAIRWFLDTLADTPGLRAFLANERNSGLRMVTAPNGAVRPRLVRSVTELIEREVAGGQYRPPAPPELLADGIITFAERYLHNGGDPTLNPDPETAHTITSLILREPCT